ncbi:MAG: hypothetical protein OIN66_18675, partial [Candidatus Methanoperedens sp.]|nr:hypothetical protein [Candidatus Methanoperedens sp.]
ILVRSMIQNVSEINRLLLAISELSGGKNTGVPESVIIRLCKSTVLMGSLPNHKDTIDFCIELKIITYQNNKLKIEHLGKTLLDANPGKYYEFTENQKKTCGKRIYSQ